MLNKFLKKKFSNINLNTQCSICGSSNFEQRTILWDELITSWSLLPEEVTYIDRQQGHVCLVCLSNLRSRTLASALMNYFEYAGTLQKYCDKYGRTKSHKILELNEAGNLSPWLSRLLGHTLVRYPEVDMQGLPYADASWDVIIHSDVLEHVENPLQGLKECYRVLKPGGVLIFTIPIIFGRLSRTRKGMIPSYHGGMQNAHEDLLVHTEYGADFWLEPITAGFRKIQLFTIVGPESIAIVAER